MNHYRQIYKEDKTMMYKINFKKNLVNIHARVNEQNEVVVTAPYGLELTFIDQFVLNNFDKFYEFIQNRKTKSMLDLNENIVHLHGIKYNIECKLISGRQKYEILGNKIYLFLNTEENKLKLIQKLFFDQGNDYIIAMAKKLAKKLKFDVSSFETKWYKNKWGQCEPNKRKISLAIQLIMFNDEIIEYVIIHELCHLVHADHSNQFWKLVESFYPRYEWAREKMKFQV